MAYKIKSGKDKSGIVKPFRKWKFKNLMEVEKLIKTGQHPAGDYVIVGRIPYQMVSYSMEGYGKGSRWVSYYNPYTNKQIDIDYAEGTVDFNEAVIDWKKDMALDKEFLKKRF